MSTDNASDILVVIERGQDTVTDLSVETLGAARQLADATGGQVIALVPGGTDLADTGALAAADRTVIVTDPLLEGYAPAPWLSLLEHFIDAVAPRAILIGSSSIGLDLGPLVAARRGLAVVNNCRSIVADDEGGPALSVTAGFYGGKLLADLSISSVPAVLLIAAGAFGPATLTGAAAIERIGSPVPLDSGAVVFHEMVAPASGDIDISQQDILVAVGRGVQQEDNLEVVQELADALGAAVAASRPVVDQGWLPPTRQVGKSGMKVKPKCYLALGISGAPEHVEGMQNSDLIIAVNTDPKAPIFDVAHYGAVADMLDVAESLTEVVQEG